MMSLRFETSSSRGRRYREPAHPYRDDFQRDRDRVVHSRAFRRLESKTQVFTQPLSDHFRNRLTHTIEVAQVTRTAARALDLNEDLAETLALAHDLGHPPFGHAGEEALDEEMSRRGERFDHNLHALRVVEQVERRYPDYPGLNLTYEVREGLVKHSRDYAPGEAAEVEEYDPGARPPLEAQLIDRADEIAYNCADLDDAFEARMVDPQTAAAEVALFGRIWERIEREQPGARRWTLMNLSIRELMNELVSGLIEGSRGAIEAAGVETVEQVRAHRERLAVATPETAAASRDLKALLAREVYQAAEVEREALEAAEKVRAMFRRLEAEPERMPGFFRERVEQEKASRVVCDYIAGMTDNYLLRRHAELFG